MNSIFKGVLAKTGSNNDDLQTQTMNQINSRI